MARAKPKKPTKSPKAAPAEPTPAELLDAADDPRPPAQRIAEARRTGNTDLVARVRAEVGR